MIEIKYEEFEDAKKLSIRGHAEYANKGEDIVCAAVSSLFCTLASNANRYSDYIDIIDINEEGEDEWKSIYLETEAPFFLDISIWFDFVMRGLKVLSRQYPQNIKIVEG